ncbi:MAG: hypothetical protein HY649_07540 [Acidobacteria bacterium]|nr:hypothetical protein [Acidobacteriota bacterium]
MSIASVGAFPVAVTDSAVVISNLTLDNPDIIQYFKQLPEEERPRAAVRAFEIGVFCLQRTQLGHSMDFVRSEVERLMNSAATAISNVPAQLEQKLGGDTGALAPIRTAVNAAKEAIDGKAQEVTNLFNLHLDPTKPDATLGKALSTVKELINPENPLSVQQKIESAIASVSQKDGTLAAAVKTAVTEALTKLENAVENLRNALLKEKGKEEAKEKGPGKGGDFEDQLYPVLQRIAKPFGDLVVDVHNDHKAGDFVVSLDHNTIPGKEVKVAIDAKSGKEYLPNSERVLAESKKNWNAQAAMLVFAGSDFVPLEQVNPFGPLANGFVCVYDKEVEDATFLAAAYRISRLEAIREVQRELGVIEPAAIEEKIKQAATKLRELSTLKRDITGATTAVTNLWTFVDRIQRELFDLLDQARLALGSNTPLPDIPKEPTAAS